MRKKFIYTSVAIFLILFFVKKINDGEIPHLFLKQTPVSVLSFGDIMFDRGVRNIIENRGRDPFEHIKKDGDFIKDFDVVVANLEGPIVVMNRADCQQKAYNFQFAPESTERLKSVGITMVNIANNHSFDCYRVGFESTKSFLQTAGIDYMGDSEVEKSFVIKHIHDKKVVFVGIDRTVSGTPMSQYYELVKKLKVENDFVVVHIHWGTEYSLTETDDQIVVAHGLIDSGVDVIFGHHPHVIEPIKIYKGKVIFYSLGNFVFDQVGVEQTQGIGASVEFRKNDTVFTVFPYKIKLFAPDFLKDIEKENFCDEYLKNITHEGCSFSLSK